MDPEQQAASVEGVAILRVWREEGTREVRARLTAVDDVTTGAATAREWTGAGIASVMTELRTWLERWSGVA
ncbi:MAG TPA: hypothetical protein VFN44_15310 [Solirubrobacteraceae bacterium]|nr:hypothetical protein [Solirubrobacteraceae bacterium]